jgi:hypothetical protein
MFKETFMISAWSIWKERNAFFSRELRRTLALGRLDFALPLGF